MFGMFPVFHWLWTNVGAGFLVLVIGAFTVVPRINARIADVSAAFNDRREFKRRITTILALCGRLDQPLVSEDPVLSERFASERTRWLNLLDEHTIWLADNLEWYSLGWPGWSFRGLPSLRDIALGYAGGARSIMLSNIPPEEKVRRLQELTFPTQVVFCQRRTPRLLAQITDELTALRALMIELGSWQGPMPQASKPAPPPSLPPSKAPAASE